MTHDELLAKLSKDSLTFGEIASAFSALRAVVELHSEREDGNCAWCGFYAYPCPTNQAIERELK